MTRLLRILGVAAALALGATTLGCPWFHDAYPPTSNTCSRNTDCVIGESCSDASTCVPAADDAGVEDGPSDGGSHAG
jgi:hypothetical protein